MSKILLKFQSSNKDSLNSIFSDFLEVAKKLKLKFFFYFLPNKKKLWTLMKSVFVYKKSKEQFELIRHKRVLVIESNNIPLHELNSLNVPSDVEIKFQIRGKSKQ